jgi:hypothetical protein
MLQLPSNLAALAGGAKQTSAAAADNAKAHKRLPIMLVPMRVLYRSEIRAPRRYAQPARNPQTEQCAGAPATLRGFAIAAPIAGRHYQIETGFPDARLILD